MTIEQLAQAYFDYAYKHRVIEISCHKRGNAHFSIHSTIVTDEQRNRSQYAIGYYIACEDMFGKDEFKAAVTKTTNEYFERVNAPFYQAEDLRRIAKELERNAWSPGDFR